MNRLDDMLEAIKESVSVNGKQLAIIEYYLARAYTEGQCSQRREKYKAAEEMRK